MTRKKPIVARQAKLLYSSMYVEIDTSNIESGQQEATCIRSIQILTLHFRPIVILVEPYYLHLCIIAINNQCVAVLQCHK